MMVGTSPRPHRVGGVLVVAAFVALLGCPLNVEFETVGDVRYVAPIGVGSADGTSWDDAAPLHDIPRLVADLESGGQILLRADQGAYVVGKPIILGDRSSDAPVTIRGVDPSGRGMTPLLVGGRTAPYSPETAATGGPGIALTSGADHLTFDGLRFKNFGNGCFLLKGAVQDLTISNVRARNVRRFVENEDLEEATVVGLVIRRTTVIGFSKDAVRLRNDTHDVLIEDVVVDSHGQDGDLFAMGLHLLETVHDVTFRRVVAMNARDTVTEYHNGDGFVAESDTYALRFEDTKAIGNMDAGYDIKASDVVLLRASAGGNKRNFRFWGSDILVVSGLGADPIRRGGLGSQAQVWAGPAASFRIEESRFVGGDPETVVFELEAGAIGVAVETIVRRARGSDLISLSEAALMTLNGRRLTG
jgi:hypothetical protein